MKRLKQFILESKKLPSIFESTIYRLPTTEELYEVDSYNLSADEIITGFSYTIIGRGMRSKENTNKIIESISLLSKLFPDNNNYKVAFNKVNL